ncbi:hypothetical protein POF50_033175 [Streptomyces sp. SL13]|uniref:Bacterial CdiA-CT RNAse A domain-containing protein n=1 Tax=Streptantibioticus silvisoli TaxID=2705255 RepID=A0AA90KC71_9ACTN|nr:RNase A-like domain-containing protein [Streptantibioticus silvisoli]MDI5964133.1 hypothetical protein [Streptantibioticus silvisoli]MDI5974142.1 hypothetical protein [Streptantibioticus silvisoli]
MRTRAATYPNSATARWCTQQVVRRNEQRIHRWLAVGGRRRLTLEAAWPSREQPVGMVLLQAMELVGAGPVDVRAARVVLVRDAKATRGFAVLATFPINL